MKKLESAFFFSVTYGSLRGVKLSLDTFGVVDINVLNSQGLTALMVAASNGNEEICEILLDHGADRSIKNPAGLTACDMAREGGYTEIVSMLENIPEIVDLVPLPEPEEIEGKNEGLGLGDMLDGEIKTSSNDEILEITVREPEKIEKTNIVSVKIPTYVNAEEKDAAKIRSKLEALAQEIRDNYPATLEDNRLLNGKMIKLFMEHRPRSRDEFTDTFSQYTRTKININEARDYLERIYEIFAYYEE